MSKNRTLASLISNTTSKVKQTYIDSDAVVTSASLGVTAAAGTATYSSADTLPASATNGDQALVTSTNRLYIYSSGGWYNIALINTTPYWSSEASTSYDLNVDGTATTITILAVDSEGVPITYTATTDSDFDGIATITKDSDNGRIFTVIPTDSENGTAVAGSGTVTFKASDGVNIVSTLSTFSIAFTVTNSNYTTLLLKADSDGGTLTDHSTNNYTVTSTPDGSSVSPSATAFSPYHPGGYSTYFDGVDDGLIVQSTSDFGFGTSTDFTLEAWIYPTTTTGDRALFDFRTSANDTATFFIDTSTGKLAIWNGSKTGATGTVVSANEWHHVAFVRSGSTTTAYLDGSVDFTTTTSFDFSTAKPLGIGRAYYASSSYFTGYYSDYRIVSGTAVYTSTFTPPTQRLTAISGTVLLACHAPYIADGSSSGHTLGIGGGPSTKRFGPYDHLAYTKTDHGGSIYTNGGNRTGIISNQLTALGTSDFTVSGWWYPTDTLGSGYYAEGTTGSATGPFLRPTTGYIGNSGSFGTLYSSDPGWKKNAWNHWMVTKSGTVNNFYLNGKYVGGFSGNVNCTSQNAEIGTGYQGAAWHSAGWHADVRRVIGTAVHTGTGTYTIPTSPVSEISGTSFILGRNDADIWDAANSGTLLTKNGNVTASTTQRKFTASDTIYFDGTGDYIDITSNKNLMRFESSTDFTVELWAYLSTVNTRNPFIAYGTGINGSPLHKSNWNLYQYSGSLYFYKYDGSTETSASKSWTPSTDTWYHIVVSRASGNLRFFIDGTQIGTTTTSNTTAFEGATDSDPIRIGYTYIGDADHYLNGYIQDVRITKGLARYTSNFTAPTAEFDG